MTPAQKAIVAKLGGVPKIKGSVMWKKYHEPSEVHREANSVRKAISHHMKSSPTQSLSSREQTDYQRRTGRGYNE